MDNTTRYQAERIYPGDTNASYVDDEALKQTLDSLETKLRELEVEHGPYHTSIANTLTNIVSIYSALGEYKQARSGVTRALASREHWKCSVSALGCMTQVKYP